MNLLKLLAIVFFFSACTENKHRAQAAEQIKVDTATGTYIKALEELMNDLKSEDVNKIKKHFSFPINNPSLTMLIDNDLSYDEALKLPVSEKKFAKKYRNIFYSRKFNEAVRQIQFADLYSKNYQKIKVNISEICYYYLDVIIVQGEKRVIVSEGVEADSKENDKGCKEATFVWWFKLIDGHLVYEDFSFA
ncbi:MAG: hypothetical protein J0L80_13780 [Chitinophagales bacterium]|jgi:hypothetical protein|nr:hypothetical protein [Chitinophagales bacterium]